MAHVPALHRIGVVLAALALAAGCGRRTDPRIQEGYDLVVAGRVDEAIAFMNSVLAEDPKNAAARNVIGLALYKSGDAEGAVDQYRQALEIDPDYPEAHFNLGNALMLLGRGEDAEAEFREAVRLQKDFVLARYNLGKRFELRGELDRALREYRTCVKYDPEFTFGFMDMGLILYRSGDMHGAIENLERTLELDPSLKEIRVYLGNAYMQSGRQGALELAEKEYRAAVGIDSTFVDAVYSLGMVLATRDRAEEAVEWFEKVLELTGEDEENAMTQKVREYFEKIGHKSRASGASG